MCHLGRAFDSVFSSLRFLILTVLYLTNMKGGWNNDGWGGSGKGGWGNSGGGWDQSKGDSWGGQGGGKGGWNSGGGGWDSGKGGGGPRPRDQRPASERECFAYRDTGKCDRVGCPFKHGDRSANLGNANNASNNGEVRRIGGAPLPVETTVTPVGGAIVDYDRVEGKPDSAFAKWYERKRVIMAAESTDTAPDGTLQARWRPILCPPLIWEIVFQIMLRIHPNCPMKGGGGLGRERSAEAAQYLLQKVMLLDTMEMELVDPHVNTCPNPAVAEIPAFKNEFKGMLTDLASGIREAVGARDRPSLLDAEQRRASLFEPVVESKNSLRSKLFPSSVHPKGSPMTPTDQRRRKIPALARKI